MRSKKNTTVAFVIMAFIFIQSALPADVSSAESGKIVDLIARIFQGFLPFSRKTIVFLVRKGAHFIEYTIFGFALLPAVKEWTAPAGQAGSAGHAGSPGQAIAGKELLAAWLIGALYAVTDEIHQCFVPGRSCEFRDMVIDSCGVLAGVLIISLIMRRRKHRKSGGWQAE